MRTVPKNTHFSRVLRKLRSEQGFSSAYSFYHQRGGKKVMMLTFANYLSLEQGKSLPQGPRLRSLIAALGLTVDSVQARELIQAYARDILGSDDLLRALTSPHTLDQVPASWQIAENAARQALSQRSVQLSLKQYEALAKDGQAYACHVVLCNTRGWIEKKDLAAMTGQSEKELERSLAALKAVGLAQLAAAKARSPLGGKYVVPPVVSPATAAIYSRLQAYRSQWVHASGKPVYARYLILRAPESKFAGYLPHLADVVSMSALYGDVEPAPDSAMYLVEGRVTRLFDGKN